MPSIDLGKVVGPQGERGDTGPQGPQGIQGIQGQTGPGVVPGGAENNLLAKNSTVDYDTKWMTMSQVGTELVKPDNPVGVALSGKASNPNLLDNWYFIGGGSQQGGGQFPINQRGKTEYTGRCYGIDRWVIYDPGSLTLETDGVLVEKKFIVQMQEPSLKSFLQGKTVTISALVSGGSGSIGFINQSSSKFEASDTAKLLSHTDQYKGGNNIWENFPCINNTDNSTIKIIAAKLELGPVQTLAHQDASGNWVLNDPPPNFQQELAKCQRYQIFGPLVSYYRSKINSDIYVVDIPTNITMRSTPTIIGSPKVYDISTSLEKPEATVSIRSYSKNAISITINRVSEPCFVSLPAGVGLDSNL